MVRDWFYPSYSVPDPYSIQPPDMRQVAVQHVQMWSFKDPKLPRAIIATANLTDARLHDTTDRREAISHWALRSIYAMAFCRFVNGFVDRDIAKAALKATATTKPESVLEEKSDKDDEAGATSTTSRGDSSMYAHAVAIGMPEQFVDLRHRATHEEMPSLDVLREMATRGLEWLWERWWKLHATDDPRRALRERAERRLLAARKAEARTLNGAHEGPNDRTDNGAAAANGHSRAQRPEDTTDGALDEADDNDSTRGRGGEGKRKLDVHDGDVDTDTIQHVHKLKKADKLAQVKTKPWKRPAFGLFDPQ